MGMVHLEDGVYRTVTPHQALNSLAIDIVTLLAQAGRHTPNPIERGPRILLIEQAHQF